MSNKTLSPKKIFLDRDGDGIVDTVDLQLHLYPSCSNPTILSAIMDLSACLGFETMGMDLPLVNTWKRRDSSFNHHLHIGLNHELYLKRRDNEYCLKGEDEISLVRTVMEFSLSLISTETKTLKKIAIEEDRKRKEFDLLNPFSNRGFFCNSSKSILPFLFRYKILLFSHLDLNTAAEATNFAARLGLESLHLSLPLAFPFEKKPKNQENFIYIGKKEDLMQLRLSGLKEILSYEWDSGIFLLLSKGRVPNVLICGDEEGLKEILGYLSRLRTDSRGVRDPIFERVKTFSERLRGFILGKPSNKVPSSEKIVKDYIIADEREEIIRLLKKGLNGRTSRPDSIEIQISMARPEYARRKFREEVKGLIKEVGLRRSAINMTVLNAYKPGLSWIKEVVLREIAHKKVDKVEIAFKGFEIKGLEESIRWLQELHPIDEILSRRLSIPKEKIEFKKDSRMKEVYRVRVWKKGRIIYEDQFSPCWIEQPYLLGFSRLGKVHPCTGWIRMRIDGDEVVNQRIKTWMEWIWEIYQKEILSLLEEETNKILPNKRSLPQYPIFEEIRFDIFFDYPMESLGIDEERISPLEALHEDLYFVTLEFFSQWMKKKGLKDMSLGRVLPVIHPHLRGENGRIRFTLVHHSPKPLSGYQRHREIRTGLLGFFVNKSKVGIDLSVEAEKREDDIRLRRRLRSHKDLKEEAFEIKKIFGEMGNGRQGFRLIASGPDFSREREFVKKAGRWRPIQIPMERPIGYREGVKIIRSLRNLPGVNVVEEGRSFGGLPIFSIENTYPNPRRLTSHAKRILAKPTFFINCRHHANEISSTNAGLKLSSLLVTQPQFKKFLKKANVVTNPMENVDGMVLLEEMLKLTPKDKLHGGRYNSVGREYYGEYFNPETPFGEAKVKPAIWERWVPDICVDDHGFPSHEWEQPFSGYAPFRFREWWIPRALFYIYLPHLDEKTGSNKRINSEVLKNWLLEALSKEKGIMRWNQTFSERYLKYRQRWLKNHIKSSGFIPYLPLQKRFRKTNYSYRFPHITAIDLITEVADETAQGRFLSTCINAHLKTNLSILKLLSSLNIFVRKLYRYEGGQSHFIWYRERPLNLKHFRKEGY